MNMTHRSEPRSTTGNNLSKNSRRMLAPAAALALLAACASGPTTNGEETASKLHRRSAATTQIHPERQNTSESQILADKARAGAEALAANIFNVYENSPAKTTFSNKDKSGLYETINVEKETGEQIDGAPVTLHIATKIGRNSQNQFDPSIVDYVDIRILRGDASTRRQTDEEAGIFFDFQVYRDVGSGGWRVRYGVNPDGVSRPPTTNDFLTTVPNGDAPVYSPLQEGQLDYYLNTANNVVSGETSLNQLFSNVLPA